MSVEIAYELRRLPRSSRLLSVASLPGDLAVIEQRHRRRLDEAGVGAALIVIVLWRGHHLDENLGYVRTITWGSRSLPAIRALPSARFSISSVRLWTRLASTWGVCMMWLDGVVAGQGPLLDPSVEPGGERGEPAAARRRLLLFRPGSRKSRPRLRIGRSGLTWRRGRLPSSSGLQVQGSPVGNPAARSSTAGIASGVGTNFTRRKLGVVSLVHRMSRRNQLAKRLGGRISF